MEHLGEKLTLSSILTLFENKVYPLLRYSYGLTTRNVYGAAQDGWQWEDNLNLLGYIPLAMNGASRFIAGAKAAKNPKAANVDASAQHLGETNIKAGTGCFVAGTEILTTEGIKNIEDIRAGDWVIADDPTTPGEIEKRQVLVSYERAATKLIDIYVDGEVISATEEHPFWVVDKGWVEPKDLQVGDLLQTEDGRIVDVDKIEKREGDFKVYNFSVEGIPTYFVSQLGILVHNNTNCFEGVSDYFRQHSKLPDNFITKDEARQLGWNPRAGNLDQVAPGKSIGGDIFRNRGGDLPEAPGRTWYEADIGYTSGYRGNDRILYSSDGILYKTSDHYRTFQPIQ